MKVTLLTENLKRGLGLVARAASTRSTLPVLGNVLLQTVDGRLRLACSNLEMTIIATVGAVVEADGATTVPVKTISDLVGTVSDDKVMLTLDAITQTLKLESGRVAANIKGITAEEFPLIDTALEQDADYTITMPVNDVIRSARRVLPSISGDNTRPILGAISWELNGSSKMVATDGFRLSLDELHDISNGEAANALVPGAALAELVRVAEDDVDVTIHVKANRVIFDMDSIILMSQLIDGTYPDYTPILPKSADVVLQCDKDDLSSACRAAAVFARHASNASTLTITYRENAQSELCISALAPEAGNNRTVIDCEVARCGSEEGLEVTLNIQYLLDAINTIDGDTVEFRLNGPMAPAAVTAPASEELLHVIMPVHFGK